MLKLNEQNVLMTWENISCKKKRFFHFLHSFIFWELFSNIISNFNSIRLFSLIGHILELFLLINLFVCEIMIFKNENILCSNKSSNNNDNNNNVCGEKHNCCITLSNCL